VRLPAARAVWALLAALAGCGNEYVCPDPVGPIIRDDCDSYRTRYESLKMELSFSIGKFGVSASAGKEKLRDPSELLQLLMQQTMTLCRDFNSCRVPSEDYRRRREDADRKFTAITAISQQLKGDLDADSKKQLVAKLIEVLSDSGGGQRSSPARPVRRVPVKPCKHFLARSTSMFFGSKFAPPRPGLPQGVPALAWWEMTHSRGIGRTGSYIHLTLWGATEPDDMAYVTLSDGGLSARAKVSGKRDRPVGRVSFKFDRMLWERGTMTLAYRVGATLKKHTIGTFQLDHRVWRSRGYLAYMPDPVLTCPLEYERPWLVFFTRVSDKVRVTVRCSQNGKPVNSVLEGRDAGSTYRPSKLDRHHVPLPVRIPLKGGRTRGSWHARLPGEKVPVDMFPDQAAGKWQCQVSLNGRPARRIAFQLRSDGSVVPTGRAGPLSPPWFAVKTEPVENDLERRRDRELDEEDAKLKAREEKLR